VEQTRGGRKGAEDHGEGRIGQGELIPSEAVAEGSGETRRAAPCLKRADRQLTNRRGRDYQDMKKTKSQEGRRWRKWIIRDRMLG